MGPEHRAIMLDSWSRVDSSAAPAAAAVAAAAAAAGVTEEREACLLCHLGLLLHRALSKTVVIVTARHGAPTQRKHVGWTTVDAAVSMRTSLKLRVIWLAL
jgi:hypothetical protein